MPTIQQQAPWYALTTKARIRARLKLNDDGFDDLLVKYITGATDQIESECGLPGMERYPNDGHFLQKKYNREQYTIRGLNVQRMVLRNHPILWYTVTATLTQGNPTITLPAGQCVGLAAGMPLYDITGKWPQGTVVQSVSYVVGSGAPTGTVTMSNGASTSGSQNFEICGVIAFEWKSGPPSNPTWTPFITDQWEVEDQGAAGIVRVYGAMPTIYSNMLRLTYVAGFPHDWQNAGNAGTHRVPGDLSELCEDLVVRAFKRKDFAGKVSEGMQGAQTAWRDLFDAKDQLTIDRYRRYNIG